MPTPTIPAGNLFMNATTYAGNNGTASITNGVAGQSFQPDFVWVKNRTNAYTHLLYDSVRGVGTLKAMSSSETTAEGGMSDNSTFGYLSALNSNGFTVVSGSTANSYTNSSGNNYVGWQWKAGGAAVTNTAGSISSQVSANTTSGFSVVTFTTQASGTGTVGHGLGVAPSLIIQKIRTLSADWFVYSASIGAANILKLNTSAASTAGSTIWNSTSPTSSVFSLGNGWAGSYSTVAYCWAPIAGYSAFGSYTGNGSADGPFVYLGFRPRYILIKDVSTSSYGWLVNDTARNPFNLAQNVLVPNSSGAESAIDYFWIDFLSNGFKLRTANATGNGSGIN